jgi:CubicO group peptidase (beta-lactamase class C family)
LRAVPVALTALDQISFDGNDGRKTSVQAWLQDGYTDAFLVMHRGRIAHEHYAVGMQRQHAHAYWSMSKSVVGLLAMLLMHDGTLDPNVKLSSYVGELAGSAWADATVQEALDMTTGVAYSEQFADPKADIHRYLRASCLVPVAADYTGARTLTDLLPTLQKLGEHGQAFRYKSVDTEVLAWVLQRVSGLRLSELLSQRLWRRLGAEEDAFLWLDGIGNEAGSVGLNATLRETGRLGELLCNQGRVGNQQVVPEAVVRELRRVADPAKFAASGGAARAGYSYHNFWWVPHDADGSFEAKGLFGQHLHINPAAEVVIVKFSSHPVPETTFTHAVDRRAGRRLRAAKAATPRPAPQPDASVAACSLAARASPSSTRCCISPRSARSLSRVTASGSSSQRTRMRVIGPRRSCDTAARICSRSLACAAMRRRMAFKAAAARRTSLGPRSSAGAASGSSPRRCAASARRLSGRVATRTASTTPAASTSNSSSHSSSVSALKPSEGACTRKVSGVPSARRSASAQLSLPDTPTACTRPGPSWSASAAAKADTAGAVGPVAGGASSTKR